MSVEFQPIPVATGCADTAGLLALDDGRLIAVLVRLDDPVHGDALGRWFLEARFGGCATRAGPSFGSCADAEQWVRRRLN